MDFAISNLLKWTSFPSIKIDPYSGFENPEITRNKADFPLSLGPTIAIIDPRSIPKESPAKTERPFRTFPIFFSETDASIH